MKKYFEKYTIYVINFMPMRNPGRTAFYWLCSLCAHWASVLLQVFTRRDFGIRYFDFGFALRLALILLLIPVVPMLLTDYFSSLLTLKAEIPPQVKEFAGAAGVSFGNEPAHETESYPYLLWYAFIALFVTASFFRWREQRSQPSLFEQPRHTYFRGTFQPWLGRIEFSWLKKNTRILKCWIEPAVFFLPGLVLLLLGQNLGWLLLITAIICSGYENFAYSLGRSAVLNTYDKMIEKKWAEKSIEDMRDWGKDVEENHRKEAMSEEDFRSGLHAHATANLPPFEPKILH